MAKTPRNDPHAPPATGSHASQGARWGLIIGGVVVVVLILYLMFGNLFTNEPLDDVDPVVEPTTTDPLSEPDVTVPEPAPAETETAPQTPTTAPDTGTTEPEEDSGAIAPDAQEDGDDVINIEGDAEVEILDDS